MEPSQSNAIIGKNIKSIRLEMGLTQEALANYLQTTREQVAYYELGQRPVSSTHLAKLADLFCINEYDFYEEDPVKRSIHVAFAFRAGLLNNEDLQQVAAFKKVVRNYVNMKSVTENE